MLVITRRNRGGNFSTLLTECSAHPLPDLHQLNKGAECCQVDQCLSPGGNHPGICSTVLQQKLHAVLVELESGTLGIYLITGMHVCGLHLQGIQTEAAVADLSVGATLDQSFHLRITLDGYLGVDEKELNRLYV